MAPRLALVSRATLSAAVAVGGAVALASVAAGSAGHLPVAGTVLTGCPPQAATLCSQSLLDTVESPPFWEAPVSPVVVEHLGKGHPALRSMVGVVVLVPVEVLDGLQLPKTPVVMEALAEVVARLLAPLHLEEKAALAEVVAKALRRAARAAPQSFASTTEEQP